MTKRDPNAEWDDIPGFNGQTGEYVRLGMDGWLKAHRIREKARELGLDNFRVRIRRTRTRSTTKYWTGSINGPGSASRTSTSTFWTRSRC